jgi:hypothetical protein
MAMGAKTFPVHQSGSNLNKTVCDKRYTKNSKQYSTTHQGTLSKHFQSISIAAPNCFHNISFNDESIVVIDLVQCIF